VGGQTIGKMALGTCVVDDDGRPVDAARALRRTSGVMVSLLLFGIGFIPALFGEHRALHDRYAGTRVVRLRSV
jgi:Predicted membrane protein/domain